MQRAKTHSKLRACIVGLALALCLPCAAYADDASLTVGGVDTQAVKAATAKETPAKNAFTSVVQTVKVDNSKGGLITNGKYYITKASNATKVIGASGAIQTKTGKAAQQWMLKFSYDTQCYTITNMSSNKVLTVSKKGKNGSKVTEAKLVKKRQRLSAYATRNVALPTQRWILKSNSKGYYLVSAANKKVALDLSGSQAKVMKTGSKGSKPYVWFVGVNGTFANNGIGNGTYTITSEVNGKNLNVKNSAVGKKTKDLVVSKARTAWGQMFDFVYVGKGYYKILSFNTGFAMTATTGNRAVQYPYKTSMRKRQLWKPVIVGSDGAVQFINQATGKALTRSAKGYGVMQKASAANVAQHWYVKPTATGLTYVGKKALYWANKKKSATRNCIVIDLNAHELFLFRKAISTTKGGPWVLEDTCRCASGANYRTEGGTEGHPYVSTTSDYAVTKPWRINGKWCVSISGGSDIHSITYDGAQGDNQLGWFLSGGCIRVPFKNAEYIYKNTKPGTKCIRYYSSGITLAL